MTVDPDTVTGTVSNAHGLHEIGRSVVLPTGSQYSTVKLGSPNGWVVESKNSIRGFGNCRMYQALSEITRLGAPGRMLIASLGARRRALRM